MFTRKRWSSIRFRIVLIYFLLVFIAMTVIGVFIMNQLEAYQMELIRSNFTKIVQESVNSLQEGNSGGYSVLGGKLARRDVCC